MELRDDTENSRFSSPSSATENSIHNGKTSLLISFPKQSNRIKKKSNDVIIRPAALLHSIQHSGHQDYPHYQSDISHHISSSSFEKHLEQDSISIIKSWPEDIFYSHIIAVITSIGVIVAVVWIVFWFRNNIWRIKDISEKKNNPGSLVKEQFIMMDSKRHKYFNTTNVNTCLELTVTQAESRFLEIEDTLDTDKNKSVNKNKETLLGINHTNMSQLEMDLKCMKTAQQHINRNCEEKGKLIQAGKRSLKTKEEISMLESKAIKNKEYSLFNFQTQENNYDSDIEVEQLELDENDLNPASISAQSNQKIDSHRNDKNQFITSDEKNEKYNSLCLKRDNSQNYSDTSTSFTSIPPPTPSSVSSSIASPAVSITPYSIVDNLNSACKVNKQFTFSPKLLKDYEIEKICSFNQASAEIGSKKENSYYRFPDVDSPTILSDEKSLKKKSLTYSSISPKQSFLKNTSNSRVNYTSKVNSTNSAAELFNHHQNNASLSNQATRRARLKSISLDSDGARLIEETLSSGIPVEELVEKVANQNNFTADENKTATINSYALFKKHRNILNLKLNLNDQTKPLENDKEHSLNNFFVEYYDYGDEDETSYRSRISRCTGYSEKHPNQYTQILQPKTPTLTLNRKKATSLDSDQYLNHLLPSKSQGFYEAVNDEQLNSHKTSTSSIRASSLSVPSTPERQLYRLPHHQQQSHCKPKQNEIFNENSIGLSNNSSSDRHMLCLDDKSYVCRNQISYLEDDKLSLNIRGASYNQSTSNLRTLPEVTSCSFTDKLQKPSTIDIPALQNSHKSRPSILQRRGSNHSLTLNIDAPKILNKGLSVSNFSLGNHKGSYLNLVSSSINLSHNQSTQNQPSNIQTKKNLLQRRGSNNSLVLNLQGSTASLNRFNSHNSLNIHNQLNNRSFKKGLIERRNSNTNMTNLQNQALSVSNCNIPGSNCSLYSMITNQTQNEGLMLVEDEQQVVTNNNQSKYCSIVDPSAENLSRLTLHCAQHASRRKFLSSDSIHNIARSRVVCCCQKEQNCTENLRMSENFDNTDSYCETMNECDQPIQTFKNICACSTKTNTKVTLNNVLKFKSAAASTTNLTQYTKCECYCNCEYALSDRISSIKICTDNVRKITTKPLSPQTTSEDFKIYLANIQFLQNASNILSVNYMKNLHLIFNETYGNYVKTHDSYMLSEQSDDVLMTKISNVTVSPQTSRSNSIDTEKPKNRILKIHQEFWDLPTNYQEKPLVFGSQTKNRYKTILPNEHSRVILNAEFNSSTEPYINANFIKGPDFTNNSYIATQGPMPNTVYDFWLMVYQNIEKTVKRDTECLKNVKQKIIMLTDFVENSRQKCAVYFPQQLNESMVFTCQTLDKTQAVLLQKANLVNDIQSIKAMQLSRPADASINFNYFLITNVGMCIKNGYSLRKLLVIYSYQAKNTNLEICNAYIVYHYWFPDWPDHRSPEDIDALLDISMDILDNDCSNDFEEIPNSKTKSYFALPIIHCSAGIGRTGCLLAILNGLIQIRSSFNAIDYTEVQTDDNDLQNKSTETQQRQCSPWISPQIGVDILGIVCNLRLQRGGMVQNSEQYELIHRVLCLFMQTIDNRGKI